VAKAVAALLSNGGEPLDYLEVIGAGKPIEHRSAPCIAVPTTAGTGSEVTRNAVLASPEHGVKVSMRSPLMLPTAAVVDPELTWDVPADVTASTGLDALAQVIEPFVSKKAGPLTDPWCRQGMRSAAAGLLRAYQNPADQEAREAMALASLMGGFALANAKLGAAHGFAGPIGGMFPAPHGIICARTLPFVIEVNVRALQQREPDNPALARFDEVGALLTGDETARAADALRWVTELCDELAVPGLSTYGIGESDIADIVPKASRSSSMKGNPIELNEDELTEILQRAL
jgi:alcohol dehydrogenase class IV